MIKLLYLKIELASGLEVRVEEGTNGSLLATTQGRDVTGGEYVEACAAYIAALRAVASVRS